MNFSFSAISAFQSCPKSFEFKYIRQLPEAFVTIERQVGTCIHEILRWAYEKREADVPPDLEMVKAHFHEEWGRSDWKKFKIIKKGLTEGDYHKEGLASLVSFFQRVFPLDKSTTLQLEHKFDIRFGDGIQYKGIIDRISRQPDGMIRVIDFKTGRVTDPLDNLQLPSYALYIFEQYPDDWIELCYEDLNSKRTIVSPCSRGNVPAVRKEIADAISQIRNTDIYKANPSVLCQWCGYNEICESPPPGRKGRFMNQNRNSESDKAGENFCPECGSVLKERKGKFGSFLGCSNFPQCRYTLNRSSREKGSGPNPESKEICPECGGILRERNGKYGPFLGCSRYPECRFTRKIVKS